MNLPNLLTLLRIVLIPPFVILLSYGYRWPALGVFLAAGLTDALDGFIARTWRQQTELGRALDPLADKLLLNAAFITLGVLHWVPLWLVILIISRDLIILVGGLFSHLMHLHVPMHPTVLGKGTTVSQLVYVSLAMALSHTPPALVALQWLTAGLTVLSGLHYLYRGIRAVNAHESA